MRDKIKNKSYFEEIIQNTNTNIDFFYDAILNDGITKDKSDFIIFIGYFRDRFLAQYSSGADFSEYNEQCTKLVKVMEYLDSDDFRQPDLIDCLCILVLTNQSEDLISKYLSHLYRFGLDNEIFFLIANQTGYSRVKVPYLHDYWLSAFRAIKEKEPDLLFNFLNVWYDESKDYDWHNTHLDDSGTFYTGYWCLSAAAIAKTHGLVNDRILNHQHFPKDLI